MEKTTKQDFEVFKAEFLRWAEILGLKGWRYFFEHKKDPGNCAGVKYNLTGRVATVHLALEVYDRRNVKRHAFHEACEMLLARLYVLAGSRYVGEEEIQEANHEVIRTLENAFFDGQPAAVKEK